MKQLGLTILFIGFMITLYPGLNYMNSEQAVVFGHLQIKPDHSQYIDWTPLIGLVVIAVGGVTFIPDQKNLFNKHLN